MTFVRVGSGLPASSRRTFAPALPAAVHCMSAVLRHPWLRLLSQFARERQQPSMPSPLADVNRHVLSVVAGAPSWHTGSGGKGVGERSRSIRCVSLPATRLLPPLSRGYASTGRGLAHQGTPPPPGEASWAGLSHWRIGLSAAEQIGNSRNLVGTVDSDLPRAC